MLQTMAVAAEQRQAPPWGLGRVLRLAALGLVDPGALEALELERAVLTAVRSPQVRPRIVAIVSGKGGAGATTTAAGIGLTLAALRDDATVLVNARAQGTSSLVSRMHRSGLAIVDSDDWHRSPGDTDLGRALNALTADHAFTLLDVGTDASAAARTALSFADQAVIVTGSGPETAESVTLAIQRVTDSGRHSRANTLIAMVCTRTGTPQRIGRRLRHELGANAAGLVIVPHDRRLAAEGPVDPTRLNPMTLEAYLMLAALISHA
jgi:MinD-like ATPase involved in chromosome partitioning or flagellar assembly